MLFDIHSHILPEIDDGAQNLEESLQLLEMLGQQGVEVVAATPHFYAESIDFNFYTKLVNEKFELLQKNRTPVMPKIIKGYEVRYFREISNISVIKELTLGGSHYMLLEFPYGQDITSKMVDEITDICYNFGITPIIAHIERYYKYRGFSYLLDLVDEGLVLAHVNASSFFDGYKKAALKMVEIGVANIIASDTHSVLSRPPMFSEARKVIAKHLGEQVAEDLFAGSKLIYDDIIKSCK